MHPVTIFNNVVPNHNHSSHFEALREGLPHDMEVYRIPNGEFEIKPLEGGGLGYGVGRAMRMGFDSLSDLFHSVVAKLPQPSLLPIRGASALEIHDPAFPVTLHNQKGNPNRKDVIKKDQGQQLCQPRLVSSIDLDGQADSVAILGKYAYLTTYSDNQFGNDFNIINIANPSNPVLLSSNPWGNIYVAVSGHYAYVTYLSSGAIQVIDIANPSQPSPIGSCSFGEPWTIIVSGKYAYSGDFGGGLLIFDITNPEHPKYISSCDESTGTAGGIVLSESYVFLANEENGLQIVNVANPLKPILVGAYPVPGYAYDVAVSGKYAYIADGASGLQIVDINQPSNPIFVSSYYVPKGAWCVAVFDHYVAVGDQNNTLHVVDVTNPSKPTFAGSCSMQSWVANVNVLKDYAYVACNSGLKIVKLNCPPPKTTPSSNKKWIIIGSGIGGGVLGAGLIGTAVTCFLKRRKSAGTKDETKPLVVSS